MKRRSIADACCPTKKRQIVIGVADGERYELLGIYGTDDRFTYAIALDSNIRVLNPDVMVWVPDDWD